MLTNLDITELTEFRRELHRHPELSGDEAGLTVEVAPSTRGSKQ